MACLASPHEGVAVWALIGNYSTESGVRRPSPSFTHFECLYPPAVPSLGVAYRALNKRPNSRVLCSPTDGDINIHRHHAHALLWRIQCRIHNHLSCLGIAQASQRRTAYHQPIACLRQRNIAAPDAAVPSSATLPAANTDPSPPVCRWPFAAWSPVQNTRCAFLGRWWGPTWLADWTGLD